MIHPHVSAAAIAAVVSEWTGIPVVRIAKEEGARLLKESGMNFDVATSLQDAAQKVVSKINKN